MGFCIPPGIQLNNTNSLDKIDRYKHNTVKNLEIEYEVCQLEKMEDSLNEQIDSNIDLAAAYIEKNLVDMAKNKIKENILYKKQLNIIGVNRLSLIRIKNDNLLENMNYKVHGLIRNDNGIENGYNKSQFIEEFEVNERQQGENDEISNIINSKNEFNEKEIDRELESVVNMLNKKLIK